MDYKRYVLIGTVITGMSFGVTTEVHAVAYAPGTWSVKPINADISSYTLGFSNADSKFTGEGFGNFVAPERIPYSRSVDAFKSPQPWGFAECNRNGTGYGIEFGYLVGHDFEVFSRLGYCRENGVGYFVAGDQYYKFNSRDNYGFSLGLRKYIDMDSAWKPFIAGAIGFVNQGKTSAFVKAHSIFASGPDQDFTELGNYKLLKAQNLLTFEVSAGTDYVFNKNWAMSVSLAIRYNQRGGSHVLNYPAVNADTPSGPFPLPAQQVTYADNKQRWYIPLMVSLKCTW